MKINIKLTAFAVTIAAFFLIACESNVSRTNSSKESVNASLTETYWKLTGLDGSSVTMAAEQTAQRHLILHNSNKRIAGFSGCNNFFGQYQIVEQSVNTGNIKFYSVGSTKMACHDDNSIEEKFLKIIGSNVSYEIDDQTLILRDINNNVLANFDAVYF